jgi:hypothetical protein
MLQVIYDDRALISTHEKTWTWKNVVQEIDFCVYYCVSNYYAASTKTNLYIRGEKISTAGNYFVVKKFCTYILNRKLSTLQVIHYCVVPLYVHLTMITVSTAFNAVTWQPYQVAHNQS